jgi:hypothetical protein
MTWRIGGELQTRAPSGDFSAACFVWFSGSGLRLFRCVGLGFVLTALLKLF